MADVVDHVSPSHTEAFLPARFLSGLPRGERSPPLICKLEVAIIVRSSVLRAIAPTATARHGLGGQLKTGNLWTGQNRQICGGRDP
jgi:hypothetical protein